VNVAFITEVNLDDLSDLAGTASEIEQDLNNAGFEVISVKPWARPSLKLPGEASVPTTNQTTNQIEPIL
jgi:predicted CoA-binding protein